MLILLIEDFANLADTTVLQNSDLGAVGAFMVGILVLGEAASPLRILAAALIVSGLVLMKLTSS